MAADKRLRRPRNGRMLAGVCAGLADFFGLDVSLVRIVYALATIFTAFSGVIIYFLLVLIVPEEDNRYFRQ
ncbi:PspC domain-containing protein [Mediterranea massiliensis]|jgi:phage shock protein PspC (stress-responsive transcriptional regulator)|uniref:PspC domain-containing protein n=1 Tax=Mediterranea massiliensis TaxID=1841865 RepID=UPI0025A4114C|nr:PspC domain-containing protein [Mediterranea massiliensis]MDM8336478.1 PspC domain-containing protein [Mediterranea massiliensis]